jgi:tetratricopeptide (TPR) repeat protein
MNREQADTWRKLGTLCSFFMPVFGMLGILSVYFALSMKRKRSDKTSGKLEFGEHLRKDRVSAMAETAIITPVNWREEKEIQPLVDALKDSDVELRKGAVRELARLGDKDAIRILSNSLDNTMIEVRYHAVEELAKISKDFGDKIIDAQGKVEKNPQSKEALVELADSYYDYAMSDVEDKTLSDFYIRQAEGQYKKAVEMGVRTPKVLMQYGEILTKLERYAEALEVFKEVIQHRTVDFHVNALVALADLYFKMGNFQKVKEISARLHGKEDLSDEIKLAVSCWA